MGRQYFAECTEHPGCTYHHRPDESIEHIKMKNYDLALKAAEEIAKNAFTRSDFENRDLIMKAIGQAYHDGRSEEGL